VSERKDAARIAYRRATDAIGSLFCVNKILEDAGLSTSADRFHAIRQELIDARSLLEPMMPKLRKP